jgi:ketopantoate hydroxymethyltransferase
MHITKLVEKVDPEAIVIDTDEVGRPDLVRVAWKVYKEMGAEAVFVLSNEVVTRKVVYGLEARGVPAFGPIWDS